MTEAVQQAMDHAGSRELINLLSRDPGKRMARSLARRWQKYAIPGGVHLPGEQLVAVGAKSPKGWRAEAYLTRTAKA